MDRGCERETAVPLSHARVDQSDNSKELKWGFTGQLYDRAVLDTRRDEVGTCLDNTGRPLPTYLTSCTFGPGVPIG
eukprot:3434095-Pleurochrysis_carterae.AAC.1